MEQRTSYVEALPCHEHGHFEKATEALMQDHRVIERVLAVMEGVTKKSGEISVPTGEKLLDFFRNFADKCHHLKEEKILFPALEEHGILREGGPIGMMLAEHEEGRGYVRAMADALDGLDSGWEASRVILIESARAYLRLLPQHIDKEDNVLFQMADEVLTPEEQKQLLHEFEEHEAKEMGTGVHDKYLKIVLELEANSRS